MRTLNIFDDNGGLAVPIELITEKSAILARTGAGKSTAAAAIVEEVLELKQQVVVIDPKGDWWGLRSSASGQAAGYDIPVFGGSSPARTLDLEAGAGALIAEEAAHGVSMVIDLSEFSNAERNRFVTDFAEHFYRTKAAYADPVLVVIEEADEVVPQRVDSGNARMVGAIERIVKRGRFRGIGTLLITQRSASLNKDVLTQTEVLIVMQTTSPQDRKAIEAWVEHHPDAEKFAKLREGMSSLQKGEAFVWSPAWLDAFARVRFRRRRTYDAGQTPKVGERRTPPKVLADIDIAKLGERIRATAEELKAKDPAELRRKIARLENELAKRPKAETIEKPVPVFTKGEVERFAAAIDKLEGAGIALGTFVEIIGEVGTVLRADLEQVKATAMRGTAPAVMRADAGRTGDGPRRQEPSAERANGRGPKLINYRRESAAHVTQVVDSGSLTRPQQRVLDALAWREQVALAPETPKKMLAALAGYTWSGGFRNILSQLKSMELITYVGTDAARLSDGGRRHASHISQPATNDEAHEAARRKVKSPALWQTLAKLIEIRGEVTKEELARLVGKEYSGGFRNELSKLRTLGFVDYPQPGYVQATAVLFPEEVARA